VKETPNDPIKKYNEKQNAIEAKKTEYLVGEPDYKSTQIIGLGTSYEELLAKKKKRKKKMQDFVQSLLGIYSSKPEYQNYEINRVDFVEKLKVGKEKLGVNVTIPTVYVVELSALDGNIIEDIEKLKYEIYDDATRQLIMYTDENGNLVLSEEVSQIIKKYYKKLGLQKEDRARIRRINDQLWITSQLLEQGRITKEQEEKASVSEVTQTLDLQRKRIANAIGAKDTHIEVMTELSSSDPLLRTLLSKEGKMLKDTYIVRDKSTNEYKIVSRNSNGSYEEMDSLVSNTATGERGVVKKRNNPNASGKTVAILGKFHMKIGDRSLDLVIYQDGQGQIKAGVMDRDDKENNILELKSANSLDAKAEKAKYDLTDGDFDNRDNTEYMGMQNNDFLDQKIETAISELRKDGIIDRDLSATEKENVRKNLRQNKDKDMKNVKKAVGKEIEDDDMDI